MNDTPPCPLTHIVVPIDVNDRESAETILPVAIFLARWSGATLHFVTVVSELYLPTTHDPEQLITDMVERAHALLEEIVTSQVPVDIKTTLSASYGSIYRQIIATANQQQADLIVMSSHRPGMKSYLLGSVAARVTRHATCSVYVVR